MRPQTGRNKSALVRLDLEGRRLCQRPVMRLVRRRKRVLKHGHRVIGVGKHSVHLRPTRVWGISKPRRKDHPLLILNWAGYTGPTILRYVERLALWIYCYNQFP